jgi:hypothetical protein
VTRSPRQLSLIACVGAGLAGCSGGTIASTACENGFELGIVDIETSADIAALPRVQRILELRIVESELEDLTGFECLESVSRLRIEENAELRSLDGISNLVDVTASNSDPFYGWDIVIRDNAQLEDLAGLGSLRSVDGSLTIESNAALVDLDTLSSLETVRVTLRISDNATLERIEGFTSYRGWPSQNDFGGKLEISHNPALRAVEFESTVDAQILEIVDNARLRDLKLSLLEHPRGYAVADNPSLEELPPAGPGVSGFHACHCYRISNNDALVSLAGLAGLDVLEELVIEGNDRLMDLQGLEQLEFALDLAVVDNPLLSTCDAEVLASRLREMNPELIAEIEGNDPACR